MTTELTAVAARVNQAADYLGVFGSCAGSTALQTEHVKKLYRRLASVLHPDRYPESSENALATTAFARLSELFSQAETAIKQGAYGQAVVLTTLTTKKGKHEFTRPHPDGDLCTIFLGTSTMGVMRSSAFYKVAKQHGDNDLMQAEAAVLKRLRGDKTDPAFHPFVPELLDSFAYSEKGKPNRQVNAIKRLEEFYTLEQIHDAYPEGIDPLDAAWMWRRLLYVLGNAHQHNIVHGAVLPSHVLIYPPQHGLVLVDWCYSSTRPGDDPFPPLKAMVGAYQAWYPEEVPAKRAPSPATDIAMAARCMIYLLGGNPITGNLPEHRAPKALRAFFKGCLLTTQTMRPQDAWELLREFDELLQAIGSPYFPRRFHAFTMPTGMV